MSSKNNEYGFETLETFEQGYTFEVNAPEKVTGLALNKDAFFIGALNEIKTIAKENILYKSLTKQLFLKLMGEDTIDSAQSVVLDFLNSISNESQDFLSVPTINAFLVDAPIFKLLFIENLHSPLGKVLKEYINTDNSREQHILFAMMDMSYFGNLKSADDAKNNINAKLKAQQMDELNASNLFDKTVLGCLVDEELINLENNVDCSIGGMRSLAHLLTK